jgi:cytochrome c peroxidase
MFSVTAQRSKRKLMFASLFRYASIFVLSVLPASAVAADAALTKQLSDALQSAGFTGRIEDQLEVGLGRRVNAAQADLGRMLFFDRLIGLKLDNACAGCHSPMNGFGDTQSIAIGIDNNNIVGPNRAGPRNQRRAPMVLNTAFYPRLMWNSRFISNSGDPFDNSEGFTFPNPEGLTLSAQPHLMTAQAFIPPTERNEMTGFEFEGTNDDIRAEVVQRLNDSAEYRLWFRKAFRLGKNDKIIYDDVADALAEFQFSLTFANAPIDKFARGQKAALTQQEQRGALLFFGKAKCVQCHAVAGQSNEMFSDFIPHVIGVPQIAPETTNAVFDGPGGNEDFGLEQVTGNPDDRYKFRTSPLRNIGLQRAFFHNGAFTSLREAVVHHLNVQKSAKQYTPAGRVAADLQGEPGPMQPVLDRLDPIIKTPVILSETQIDDLVAFLRDGLLDERVRPGRLSRLIPRKLYSGLSTLEFEDGAE